MQNNGSQSVGPGPAAASLGSLLEMQNLRPHPRPTESETLQVGPTHSDHTVICVLISLPSDSEVH